MKRRVFDVETDGLERPTRIHSLCIQDPDTGQEWSYGSPDSGLAPIEDGLAQLEAADEIIGHNVLVYDLPVIEDLYPTFKRPAKVIDTLVCTRLIWTDLSERDNRNARLGFPARLIGSHGLEAWGHRLGVLKGDFNSGGAEPDWAKWTPEMQAYCQQDVRVTTTLLKRIEKEHYSQRAIDLEHRFREIITKQERHGFRFDEVKAQELYGRLVQKRADLTKKLQEVFEPTVIVQKTPAYYWGDVPVRRPAAPGALTSQQFPTKGAAQRAKAKDIRPGPPRQKVIPFNPGSRPQIADRLRKRGIKLTKETDGGAAQIDESVLEGIDLPEAKLLLEYLLIEKRIGQLAEGKNAWLKLSREGRIHGKVNTNGAVTGRCTHSTPNMSAVPKVATDKDGHVLYGDAGGWSSECRELFIADEDWVLVGADASGLEYRNLGHYLAKWDGGAFAEIVLNGDIHTANQKAFGLPEGKPYRGPSKNGGYALIYGAQDLKLGKTLFPPDLFPGLDDKELERRGAKARATFRETLPAYAKLVDALEFTVFGPVVGTRVGRNGRVFKIRDGSKARGYLIGLDGRRLHIRSPHSILNTLLQSAGALIVKLATVLFHDKLESLGYKFDRDWALVGHFHDELETTCRPEIAEIVGQTAVWAFGEAARQFNFRVPITGEYRIGRSWAEVH